MKFRKNIRYLHKKIGPKKFFSKLVKLDPLTKKFLSPSDTQRAIRAYEVKLFTKKSLYDWFKNTRSEFKKKDFFKIYIDYSRSKLIKRINIRSGKMIEKGAIPEVRNFINLKVPQSKTASKAIGIKEIRDYIKKKKSKNLM